MPEGLSIHVGLNFVDNVHYGTACELPFCNNDARKMKAIADSSGFASCLLLDEQATSNNFFHRLNEAAYKLKADDILFISFSGHGGYFQDLNGDEEDGMDEALLFYDREVIDDELFAAWAKFRAGVRILFICDACHSGTMTKSPFHNIFDKWFGGKKAAYRAGQWDDVYAANEDLYDSLLSSVPQPKNVRLKSSVLLLSACQANEVAGAGRGSAMKLSVFTEALVKCWDNGDFEGTYMNFYQQICKELRARKRVQRPNYYFVGVKHPFFEQQIPFSI